MWIFFAKEQYCIKPWRGLSIKILYFLMVSTFSFAPDHQILSCFQDINVQINISHEIWKMLLTNSFIESRIISMSTDVVADGRTYLLYEVPKMALWILVAVVLLNWPFDSTRKKSALKTVYREIFFFEIHIILLQSKRC